MITKNSPSHFSGLDHVLRRQLRLRIWPVLSTSALLGALLIGLGSWS